MTPATQNKSVASYIFLQKNLWECGTVPISGMPSIFLDLYSAKLNLIQKNWIASSMNLAIKIDISAIVKLYTIYELSKIFQPTLACWAIVMVYTVQAIIMYCKLWLSP